MQGRLDNGAQVADNSDVRGKGECSGGMLSHAKLLGVKGKVLVLLLMTENSLLRCSVEHNFALSKSLVVLQYSDAPL